MATTAQPRHPALHDIAAIGLRVFLVALSCGVLATLVALLGALLLVGRVERVLEGDEVFAGLVCDVC